MSTVPPGHPAAKFNDSRIYPGPAGSTLNQIARMEALYQDLLVIADDNHNLVINLDTLFVDMLERFDLTNKWLDLRRGSTTYLPGLYKSVLMINGIE